MENFFSYTKIHIFESDNFFVYLLIFVEWKILKKVQRWPDIPNDQTTRQIEIQPWIWSWTLWAALIHSTNNTPTIHTKYTLAVCSTIHYTTFTDVHILVHKHVYFSIYLPQPVYTGMLKIKFSHPSSVEGLIVL